MKYVNNIVIIERLLIEVMENAFEHIKFTMESGDGKPAFLSKMEPKRDIGNYGMSYANTYEPTFLVYSDKTGEMNKIIEQRTQSSGKITLPYIKSVSEIAERLLQPQRISNRPKPWEG